MMHYFNSSEGNGRSHTFCGADQTEEEYAACMITDDTPAYEVCMECDRLATEQDNYAYYYDL